MQRTRLLTFWTEQWPHEAVPRFWRRCYSSTGTCFDIGITTRNALARFKGTGDPFAGSTHGAPEAVDACIAFAGMLAEAFTSVLRDAEVRIRMDGGLLDGQCLHQAALAATIVRLRLPTSI